MPASLQDSTRQRPENATAEVREAIRRRILSGELAPGAPLPPRRAMASDFAVSAMTVQRAVDALSDDGFVEIDSTRGTTVAAAPPHLYRYGLVFPNSVDPADANTLYFQTIRQVADSLQVPNDLQFAYYDHILLPTEMKASQAPRLQADLRAQRLAGLLLSFPAQFLALRGLLDGVTVPVVGLQEGGESLYPQVSTDRQQMHVRAVAYLHDRGCRRPAVLSFIYHPDQASRLIQTFADGGLTLSQARLQICNPRAVWAVGHQIAALMLLPPDERPDALLVTDDNMVTETARALYALGVRVPDELQVLVHANFPNPVRTALPFEYIGFDCRQILQSAIELILALRRGEPAPHHVVCPPLFESELEPTRVPISI